MRITWLLPALVVVAACGGCKKKNKPPADAAPPPVDADLSTGANPGPRQLVEMGAPFSAEPDGAAGEPELAVDKDGKALLGWIEKGKVQLRRWNGTAWDAIGAPPNDTTARASGRPALAVEADGSLLVGWIEPNKQDVAVFQVARWKDSAWTPVGALGSGKQPVADPLLAVSTLGAVAVWREGAQPGAEVVQVRALDAAKGWQPLGGDGTLRASPDGFTRAAPAVATGPAGILVSWIERMPTPTLHIRRWDTATSAWVQVPAPEGVDGESTLAIALGTDGTIVCSVSYIVGLRQIVTLAPGTKEWAPIDVPEHSNGYVNGQRLIATDDGRFVFTYPFGGRFAWWDGTTWTATPVGVMAPSTVVPAAATGAGGLVFVAWSAGPANAPTKVRVLQAKKEALGAK